MTKQLFCAVGDVAFRFPRRRFLVLILPFFNREDEDDEDANNGENDLNEDDVNGCITIALITQGVYQSASSNKCGLVCVKTFSL